MTKLDAIRGAFRDQSIACQQLGSPFTAGVLRILLQDLETGGSLAAMIDAWPGNPSSDALPLRLTGALHALVLLGASPTLAACYPTDTRTGDVASLQAAIETALTEHREYLQRFLAQPPQTNEPMRSAVLLGGFLTVAGECGLPLRLLEIGASAGLNLIWDRYRYQLGGISIGLDSPVVMAAEWLGNLTMGAMPSIASRAACDQAPIDLHDPEQRLRLRSYVWADQRARLARLDGAIDLALVAGIRVDQADAGDWLAQHLVRDATGVVTVIYHSVMWQYMPEQTQRRLTDLIEQAGHRADDGAPLAWLRFEPRSDFKAFELRLSLWRNGVGEERLLAQAHPHGAKIHWLAR